MRPVLRIALLALALRLLLLWLRGDYLVYDEGYYLLLARSLREGHGFALNGLPHVALSPLQPLLVAGLSLLGIPDLWASRLLAAVCGAALLFPVASLASRWFGARGAILAATITAICPPLLTFLPFFPGERWNLYFGSEPLFLLLGTSAIAVAARAWDTGRLRLWFAAGALADLAYCTRLEGAVLGTALGVAVIVAAIATRRPGWARAVLVYASGAVVAVPYLLYLHGALGRWALSGRVQAAVAAEAQAAPARSTPSGPAGTAGGGGSDAVREFVWGGNVEALWRTLYALNPRGTQMASQYWGVPRQEPAAPSATPVAPSPSPPPAGPAASAPGVVRSLGRALGTVLPLALAGLALLGAAVVRPRGDAATWLLPGVVTALVPALLAYPEPRALLMLVPVACILAAGALAWLTVTLDARSPKPWPGRLVVAAALVLLALPTIRDASRSWAQQTPLQQVATARRIVGEYLGAHLPAGAPLVSWHPAIAIWARRDWRVLPYEPIERIVGYGRAQQASAIVFSRFEPSPLRQPPRAFTAVLLDRAVPVDSGGIHLEPVDATPQLWVGRIAPPPR